MMTHTQEQKRVKFTVNHLGTSIAGRPFFVFRVLTAGIPLVNNIDLLPLEIEVE